MSVSKLTEKAFAFTREKALFSAPCRVVVGVSGGADSMALLHCLCRWPQSGLQITVVHVHHGLRGETADRDAAFVAEQCAALGVPVETFRIDAAAVAAANGWSIEEAGRHERYRLFEEVRAARGADYILTAHTADDHVETVLMHLLRGCGTDGLCGIPAVRDRVRRPLLCCTRQEIEAFCQECGLSYVTDETNEEMCYTRNRVRHEVLPLLRQINPAVDGALTRLSHHAAEDSRLLCDMAEEALSRATKGARIYDTAVFADASVPVRRRMIAEVLGSLTIPSIEEKHILDIEDAVLRGHGGVLLPTGVRVTVSQGQLCVVEDANPLIAVDVESAPAVLQWGNQTISLEILTDYEIVHKKFLHYAIDYDKIQHGLCVRTRQEGDYFHPAGRGVGKSLKKQMIEWRIPAHLRDAVPLLCDDGGVLLVPGYACDERVRVTQDTKHFLVCRPVSEQG